MRKFIIYLVLIVFGLFLVSCNSLCDECIDINKDYICDECGGSIGRTGPIIDSYFKVEVTGSKDSLVKNLKSLYKAGEKVEIKAYQVTDVTLHVFVDDVEIIRKKSDSDYLEFEFIMPKKNITIHLTYDRFYGKNNYSFEELYYYLDNIETKTNKVSMQIINYDEKNSFIENRYSADIEVINDFKNIINKDLVKVNKNGSTGKGKRVVYNYIFNDNVFQQLNFDNNYLAWNDFSSYQLFTFLDTNYTLPYIENPDLITYQFRYDGLSSDIKKMSDDSFVERFFNIECIEFIPYNGSLPSVDAEYYLDSRYGKIELISLTIFRLNNNYYEILSGFEYWPNM